VSSSAAHAAAEHPAEAKRKLKQQRKSAKLSRRVFQWAPTRVLMELPLRVFMFAVTVFGHRWAYFWARRAAGVGWHCLRRRRQTALRNVDLCFPEKSESERTRIAKASLRHFCYTFVDYLLVPRYFKDGRGARYFKGSAPDDPYVAWINEDEPAFSLSAHFGNWEIGSFDVNHRCERPMLVIAKPINPPLVNRWIVRARRLLGNEVIEHKGGARAYARAVRDRRQIAILVDQNGGDHAPRKPLMGVPCTWQTDFTRLALRGGGRVAFQACRRVGERFQFEIVGADIHEYPPDADPMQIIADYRDYIEKLLKQWPEQYFWLHRRFKGGKKHHPKRYQDIGTRLTPETRAELVSS
jgi:Kdo2-lipid IVA lauroyltransferase/acyltransferase